MTCETSLLGGDNLQLIDFSLEDDYLIAVPYRDSLEDFRLSVTFDNINEHRQSESFDPRRQSFMRKSLAWDSSFFTSAGLLNSEELLMLNKGFHKAESNQLSHTTPKDGKRCSQSNALSCKKMEDKTRKAGKAPDLTVSKRSKFASPPTEKKLKLHTSYDSSSSTSSSSSLKNLSKSIKRKVNPKNMNLMNSPSSTSTVSSCDRWLSESLSSTTITRQNRTPVLDFQSQYSEDRKFIRQNATRSSIGTGPFSGDPKRKMKSSNLRMPSPKIGFFDEEPILNGNKLNRFQSICSKLKPKEILKNKTMNLDRKMDGCDDEKENVCSLEDQVKGLSRRLEGIDLERDLTEVKGQRVHEAGQLSVLGTSTMIINRKCINIEGKRV